MLRRRLRRRKEVQGDGGKARPPTGHARLTVREACQQQALILSQMGMSLLRRVQFLYEREIAAEFVTLVRFAQRGPAAAEAAHFAPFRIYNLAVSVSFLQSCSRVMPVLGRYS